MKNKFFAVHGHFYQPKRQDPWHNTVERESGAAPHHNWNQKITDECYGPNALKRIAFKEKDEFISNYSRISFNFGPTLFSWLEEHYPDLFISIVEADRVSQRLFGEGNAIAQVYNHPIMPLISLKDKKIQIKWGMDFFRFKFKREPLGMWLSETAVDNETLEALAEQNIKFTILSPHQAKAFRKAGAAEPVQIKDGVFDLSKPYKWVSPRNKSNSLHLFFYDRILADRMTSELENTEKFHLRVSSLYSQDKTPQLFSMASDGENYGHHIKKGDLYLSDLITRIIKDKKLELTNFSAFLRDHKSEDLVEINENTAWSCPHGVGRWKENCGCRHNVNFKSQEWRSILKKNLDAMSAELDGLFLEEGLKYFNDPEKALEEYSHCLDLPNPEETVRFIHSRSREHLSPQATKNALLLLEMQKNKLLMYTSCGWFFDDITNTETLIILKHALRAAEIAKGFGKDLSAYLKNISLVKSNLKGVNFPALLEGLEKRHYTPKKTAFEFALSNFTGYRQPFECHSDYRGKTLREKNSGSEYFVLASMTTISTLEQSEFFIHLYREKDNIFYRLKRSGPEGWDGDLALITAKKYEAFEAGDLSALPEEKRGIFSVLTGENERSKKLKDWLLKLSSINFTLENTVSVFKAFKNLTETGFKENEIPFSYETAKFLLTEALRYENNPDVKKTAAEWIAFISGSGLKSLLWKLDLLREKNIVGMK